MGYTKGEAKTKHLYNVVSKMGATGKKYPKLSSYCMGQDGRHAIVMSEDKLKGYSSVLVGLHPYQSIIIGKRITWDMQMILHIVTDIIIL